ncbi:MAG: hypothetical protein ABI353_17510 [Isosphaeraceae bacterium]
MDSLAHDFASGTFGVSEPPCLSIYLPTHRHHPDNQQDPIRFRNLLKTLEESLRQKYGTRDVRPLLKPFQELAENSTFWNHTLDGLAVLGAAGLFRVYQLQRPVPELAVAADSFHIKPLIRILQSADRYQVLGLNRQQIQLFEGNRDALDPVELKPGVPKTIEDALGTELKEPHVEVWTHGSEGGTGGVRHGSGSIADTAGIQTERFFRAVGREVLAHHSRPSGLPLVLAALPENRALFQKLSQNPFLIADGIDNDPESLSVETLRERAWKVIEPYYLARLTALIDMFGAARSKYLGTADLAETARNAVAGRVATLLIDADRRVPGRVDAETGAIEFDDLANPDVDDLIDDLGELVLRHGGQVVVVPSDRMPTQTGIAAIDRY